MEYDNNKMNNLEWNDNLLRHWVYRDSKIPFTFFPRSPNSFPLLCRVNFIEREEFISLNSDGKWLQLQVP